MALKEIGYIEIGRPDNECKLKIGMGVGSQHLFLKNEYGDFFEDIDDFFFCRQDLLTYLQDAKEEFFHPSEKYHFVRIAKKADKKQGVTSPTVSIPVDLKQYWNALIQEVKNLEEISYLGFVKGMDNDDAGRFYYHNDSTNSAYSILYRMCIPTKQARSIQKYRSIYKLVKIQDTSLNKKFIHIIPIFNMDYSIEQLSNFLKRDYPIEPEKQKSFIFDFFFKYSDLIKTNEYSLTGIIEKAGIEINYVDELQIALESFSKRLADVKSIYHLHANSERIYDDGEISKPTSDRHFQIIFYGAPGTGKSFKIKTDVEDAGKTYFRTTFHPDSDYSTFVGCYKPTMDKGSKESEYEGVILDGNDDKLKTKGNIIYSFTPQAFTNAYVKAWQIEEPVFLIIEEINRGNCAQIFGDLFQLLDRDENGYSQYKVDADTDLADYIRNHLTNKHKEGTPDYIYAEKELKLQLPNNFYIWATMNTSDQSLFPIDSAFKRRWEWVYSPIAKGKEKDDSEAKWEIEGQGENSWWKFIQGINEVIDITTHSEDKKLGFYFCKPTQMVDGYQFPKIITKNTFVNKVVFYLWNDVFKVYGFKSEIFDMKDDNGVSKKITFKSFYNEDGSVNDNVINVFVKNVMEKAPNSKSTEIENQNKENIIEVEA